MTKKEKNHSSLEQDGSISRQLHTSKDGISSDLSNGSGKEQARSEKKGRNLSNKRKPRNRKNRRKMREDKDMSETKNENDVTKDTAQEKDDFFGNQKDYIPVGGHGVGGHYREPMSSGKWRYHRKNQSNRRQREGYHSPNYTQDVVLSIRQPGWQERISKSEEEIEQSNSGILTIRQQGSLSHVLRWQHKEDSLRSGRTNRGQDPSVVWDNVIDDIRRGKHNHQDSKRPRRKKRRNAGKVSSRKNQTSSKN